MARTTDATIITDAGRSQSLELEERQKRYLITMGIRTGCFLAFLIVPGWWKVAALLAAAVLPAFAVLLANNSDHRPPAMAHDEAEERPALPPSVPSRGRFPSSRCRAQ